MKGGSFDIGVIGSGVAGIFALHRILEKQKKVKAILFDIGRPPMKRRLQMFGFGGLLPNSDGKFYLSDTKKVANITGDKKAKNAYDYVVNTMKSIDTISITKDNGLSKSLTKKAKYAGYSIIKNSYIPIFSPLIHGLLKHFAQEFENTIDFCFDKEVISIRKSKDIFILSTEDGEYKCKNVLIATGRAGWKWATSIFNKFGLVEDNSIARYGIKIEMSSDNLTSFNNSTCTLHNDNVSIGPFAWNGTVVPEDHEGMAIANFRSNEERWETDKVCFDMIGNISCENGAEETDRVGKLTFLLSNDRIAKERVSSIINNRSKVLSILPEYEWLKNDLKQLSLVIPEVLTKAYFYVPTLVPSPPNISLGNNLSTEMEGLWVAGESAGVSGLLAASEMGVIVADGIIRNL